MLEPRLLRHFPQVLTHLPLEKDSEGDFADEAMISLCHTLDTLKLREAYNAKIREVTAESIYDHAAQFASLYRDRFVCSDCETKHFYVFRNQRWQKDVGLKYLTAAIINFDYKYAKHIHKRVQFINDLALHAYVEPFEDLLGDLKVVNLKNQVFDSQTGSLRQGMPIDYASIRTRVAPAQTYREDVITMIRNIFPDEDVYRYFMRYAGSLLVPGNRDKLFMVWSGTGNNGKSILARLFELTLGEYAVRLPTSLVTSKRAGSSSATPELLLLDRKLVAFLQEPSPDEKLNIGVVKELTGNDTIYARGLYQAGRNIHVKAKMIYIVNSTENLAVIEEAVWNRIVVLPFPIHFTDKVKVSHDRPRDPDLMRKLPLYAGAFLDLMLEEAQRYLQEGLTTSPTVSTVTSSVKLDNDYIHKYLSIKDIEHTYPGFVLFMREFYPDVKPPSASAFARRF